MNKYDVAIIIGSQSDISVIRPTVEYLNKFGITNKVKILSAHRTPKELVAFCEQIEDRGIKVVITASSWAAPLASTVAAQVTIPVISIPISDSPLKGIDSLISMVQTPRGIPVATVSMPPAGSKNAAILAAQILALSNDEITGKLRELREEENRSVLNSNRKVSKLLKGTTTLSSIYGSNLYCGL